MISCIGASNTSDRKGLMELSRLAPVTGVKFTTFQLPVMSLEDRAKRGCALIVARRATSPAARG
jgi:hypothetical protein